MAKTHDMSDIRIRDAVPADAAGIARVHVNSSLDAYSGILPSSSIEMHGVESRTLQWLERLEEAADGSRRVTLVAEADDEIVGFIDAGPDPAIEPQSATMAEVSTIYVDSSLWRHGLGAELMHAASIALASAGFDEAFLYVLGDNDRACKFYEALGWTRNDEAARETSDHLVEVCFRTTLRRQPRA